MNIGMVNINNSFSGASYLPYSVGILESYARKHAQDLSQFRFLTPLFKRIAINDAVEHLMSADIVGFSLYVWNCNLSLEIARQLKRRKPEVLTVFGGPQVPDRSEAFLRQNSFIDLACHGEGEQVFLQILEHAADRDWQDIPSVSYLAPDGAYIQHERVKRLTDLGAIPSPYLTGVFDELMARHPKEEWLILWETNRGCPFACTFCDWGSSIASKVFRFDLDVLSEELEWFARQKMEFVFCCDANFGIFPRDVDIARRAAEVKAQYGYPHALSVQNAKNAEERIFQAQKILADAGLNKGVTLAFQSLDPVTLESIKRRNISLDDFRNLQRRFTEAGIETYSDLIIALPGETYTSFANGVSVTIESGQHNRIQFSNLSLLPNAEMAEPEYREKYGIETVEVRAVIYHGVIDTTPDQIHETEELVIATTVMPREDWVKTRVFCWMTALLHFDKILQIPFVVLHEVTGVSYRELVEVFTEESLDEYPILSEIRAFFQEKARSIQRGDIEQCPAPEWLNLYWPPDEYILIRLCREGRLDAFYSEAERALSDFLHRRSMQIPPALLKESVSLNRQLVKRPFETTDLQVACSFNIFELYEAVRSSREEPLLEKEHAYLIDRSTDSWLSWEDWYRKVVWYGNKKGAYLYGNKPVSKERGGHF